MWEYVMKNALKLTSIPSYRSSFNITFNVQSWEKDFLQYGFYRLNEWGYAAKTTRYSDIFRKINFCMTKNRSSEAKMWNIYGNERVFSVYIRFPIRICHMVPENVSFSPSYFINFHVFLWLWKSEKTYESMQEKKKWEKTTKNYEEEENWAHF